MYLTFRYRLYPLRPQLEDLDRWSRELAFLWNHALAQRRDAWEKEHLSVTFLEQQTDLARWRTFDFDGLGRLPFTVAQHHLQRLDLSFKEFFRRVKAGERPGYPRFRRFNNSFSYSPRQDPLRSGPLGTWRLAVPGLGPVPLRRHRPPPNGGVAKFVTVRAEADGWFAALVYQVADPPPPPDTPPERPVGIDLGLTHVATLSTGATVEPLGYLKRAERKLAREQRRLARKRFGSHRRDKQRLKIARWHARVARQRRWFAHQLSHDWTQRSDAIAMEDLNVEGLARSRRAGPVHDAGWSMLRATVEYKSRLKSHRFVAVDPRGTSQTCSECGGRPPRPLTLGDRTFECSAGHTKDRDHNAALNILERGLSGIGRKPAEERREESGPLPTRVGRRAYQRRQARSMSREDDEHPGAEAGVREEIGRVEPER